jgi:hypothetical protein
MYNHAIYAKPSATILSVSTYISSSNRVDSLKRLLPESAFCHENSRKRCCPHQPYTSLLRAIIEKEDIMDTDEWEDMLRMHERQLYELTNI